MAIVAIDLLRYLAGTAEAADAPAGLLTGRVSVTTLMRLVCCTWTHSARHTDEQTRVERCDSNATYHAAACPLSLSVFLTVLIPLELSPLHHLTASSTVGAINSTTLPSAKTMLKRLGTVRLMLTEVMRAG